MQHYLADTHAIIWYVEDNPRLSRRARTALDRLRDGSAIVHLSIISFFEMDYLIARKKISEKIPHILWRAVQPTESALRLAEVTAGVYQAFLKIPSHAVPELPDRIIVATALAHHAPLITADRKITQWDGVETVW